MPSIQHLEGGAVLVDDPRLYDPDNPDDVRLRRFASYAAYLRQLRKPLPHVRGTRKVTRNIYELLDSPTSELNIDCDEV